MPESAAADRCRELRRRRGMTQEELAEKAGISAGSVRKLEQGGQMRMETLHKIARALGVVTVTFASPTAPEPRETSVDEMVLADIRSAIHPPIDWNGQPIFELSPTGEPDLGRMRSAVRTAAVAFHAVRYDDLGATLPALVRSAHHHVEAFDVGRDHEEALRLRAEITGLAGRYLVQVREPELALVSLQTALRDALEIGDTRLAASAMCTQARAMLRQGRLGEVERLCVRTADEIEPKMSTATADQLAGWGLLMMNAAAAAARNNRPEEAREYAAVTRTAGARMEREEDHRAPHVSFGPVTAGIAGPEVELIIGHPDAALRLAERIPRNAGRASTSQWSRHLLDVARANIDVGNTDRATGIMTKLRKEHSGWLRYQQPARDAVREILATRPRMPTEEQRALAEFMNVGG